MYIHLGQDTVVRSHDVIGICDLESTTITSFAVCGEKGKKSKVYISQLSSSTLLKRSGFIDSL